MVFPFAAVISAVNMARRNNENSKKKNKEQKEVNQKINKKPKDSKNVSRIIVSYDDGTMRFIENGMVFEIEDEETISINCKNILRKDIDNFARILTNEDAISKILK